MPERAITVALAGNPNCGKTSLFNRLTGANDSVGNYARVTVAVRVLSVEHRGRTIRIADLPGIYSLTAASPEEQAGRDFLQDAAPDVVVNVVDSGNLDRSLFLTTQLIEMGRPRVIALNMIDEARRKGIRIDVPALASMLGGPAVETVASTGEGVAALLDAIVAVAEAPPPAHPAGIAYDTHLEAAIARIQRLVADLHPGAATPRHHRWLAIKLLEGDDRVAAQEGDHEPLVAAVDRERRDLARGHGQECEEMFAAARYGFIRGALAETRRQPEAGARAADPAQALDRVFLHRVFGLPIFAALLWLMFEATFRIGSYPMAWLEGGVRWLSGTVGAWIPPGLTHDLIVDGAVAGVGGTIVFVPNIVILFFFMALFSETGYLARAAFLMDRLMHAFGLHGKAFIPLVLGFDCNVPAVMATRTIESPRARLIAILITPFMACSARLPVFILFAGAFFPAWAETVVFGIYATSIVASMAASVVIGKLVVHGGSEPFVMELPPYRLPSVRAVLFHMAERGVNFLHKVGVVILIGSIVIWFLQEFPREVPHGRDWAAASAEVQARVPGPERDQAAAALERERRQERLEHSWLGRVSVAAAPVFAPLGFAWQDTTAIITGFMAKEVVVASYAVLLSQARDAQAEGLRSALAGTMTPAVALGFMVFVLLYAPCLSTIGAIWRETGRWRWAAFSVGFSFTVAWCLAYVTVHLARLVL
jgi:ferrous iron transport protein B